MVTSSGAPDELDEELELDDELEDDELDDDDELEDEDEELDEDELEEDELEEDDSGVTDVPPQPTRAINHKVATIIFCIL